MELRLKRWTLLACLSLLAGCGGDGDGDSGDGDGDSTTAAETESSSSGDGDSGDGDSGDGDSGDGDSGDGDSGDGDGDTGDGDGDQGEWLLVADDGMLPGQDTYDLAITDSGEFYVVYGRAGDGELWAKHSGDGGQNWGAPAQVTNGEMWSHTLRDKPYIVSNDQDVHVIFQDQQSTTFPTVLMPVWYSSSAGASLSFGSAFEPNIDPANHWNHFPQLAFQPDGELWLVWISFGQGVPKQGYFARESNGFTPELLGSTQTPCDCCQTDFIVTDAGDAMATWRSEWQDMGQTLRDPVVFIARDGQTSFNEEVKMSTTSWALQQCPQETVQIDEGAGKLYAAWADTTDGTYKVWVAESDDDGTTWSPEIAIAPSLPDHKSPNIAAADDGDVWVVVNEFGKSHLLHRADGAASFGAPLELVAPDDGPLDDPLVVSNGGETAVIGSSAATGAIWLYRP